MALFTVFAARKFQQPIKVQLPSDDKYLPSVGAIVYFPFEPYNSVYFLIHRMTLVTNLFSCSTPSLKTKRNLCCRSSRHNQWSRLRIRRYTGHDDDTLSMDVGNNTLPKRGTNTSLLKLKEG